MQSVSAVRGEERREVSESEPMARPRRNSCHLTDRVSVDCEDNVMGKNIASLRAYFVQGKRSSKSLGQTFPVPSAIPHDYEQKNFSRKFQMYHNF